MFNGLQRKAGFAIILTLSLLLLAFGTIIPSHAAPAHQLLRSMVHQNIKRWTVSAFQMPSGLLSTLQTSPASQQKQMLDLLFNTSTWCRLHDFAQPVPLRCLPILSNPPALVSQAQRHTMRTRQKRGTGLAGATGTKVWRQAVLWRRLECSWLHENQWQ